MPALDPIIVLVASYSIALLFLFAVSAKLTAFEQFKATLVEYEIFPVSVAGAVAGLVILSESAIILGAIFPTTTSYAMLAGAMLLLVYAGAIGLNLVRGRRDIDCGCTGPARRQSISGWLVLRNVCLALVALMGAAVAAPRALHAADYVLVGLALIGVIVFYSATNQLMANAPRLDALDSVMENA